MRKAFDLSALVLLSLAVLLSSGCQNKLDPGADPVVVNAEKSIEVAFEGVNAFIEFDHVNRVFVRERLPDVHALAEGLRRDAPLAFREAWAALDAYKLTRADGDATALESRLSAVQSLARQARLALTRIQQAKGGT